MLMARRVKVLGAISVAFNVVEQLIDLIVLVLKIVLEIEVMRAVLMK
jgi:hypothetical protein